MVPTVKRITKAGAESMDLFTYGFLEHRDVYLTGEVNDDTAMSVTAQLTYLDISGTGDIHLYINSPGGSVTAGTAIVDAIRRCRCDVSTICTGMAASMGAWILSCGTRGKRRATPLAEIMIHQPFGSAQGQASDIEVAAQHIGEVRRRLNTILSENTGRPMDVIAKDCDRDYYMNAQEAVEYGLIDGIMTENIR